MMVDDYDRSVKFVKLSGQQDDWRMWMSQFLALAYHKGYQEVLVGTESDPPMTKKLVAENDDDEIRARKSNGRRIMRLSHRAETLCFFNAVDEAKTSDLPMGDANLAWNDLLHRYQPRTALVEIELRRVFARGELKDDEINPEVYFFTD